MKPIAITCLPKIAKTTCSITLLLSVFFFGPLLAGAQSKSLSADKRAQVEKAASSFMATNSVPGISVAVVQDGALVWSQGFGMADLENFVPVTSLTLFRLGSISKPITATAVLQLSERGKLDLDVEVQKYCPAFPKKEWPITTRDITRRRSAPAAGRYLMEVRDPGKGQTYWGQAVYLEVRTPEKIVFGWAWTKAKPHGSRTEISRSLF